jgi:predicted Rossmann-fold nucleotide-binding protein
VSPHAPALSTARQHLYTPEDLYDGLVVGEPHTWLHTPDWVTYVAAHSKQIPSKDIALHDAAINDAVAEATAPRDVVGIMGGHRTRRDSNVYAATIELARELTRAGRLVATGGGPGAMEAAHAGASSAADPDQFRSELTELVARYTARFPREAAAEISRGTVDPWALEAITTWAAPAFALREASRGSAPESLAVPTWHYGHEPTTPLAPRIAKYFQNSLREDGLLAFATAGVVFLPGGPGTLQEVFQDLAQNVYRSFGVFSPMVFFNVDRFWTEQVNVMPLLRAVAGDHDVSQFVLVTDSVAEATQFLI